MKFKSICAKCNSENVVLLGLAGSLPKSAVAGAIGGLVLSDKDDSKKIRCKCKNCGNIFILEEKPNQEKLSTPCKIILHRDKHFNAALVPIYVYLNGNKAGEVSNGGKIEFTTNSRSNTIIITTNLGLAIQDVYEFDAVAGGTTETHFVYKLLKPMFR